jgi:putative oxidoreductase
MGAVLIMHGSAKVFGGIDAFTLGVAKLGFPQPRVWAWIAAMSEFAGGILLMLGFFTRIAALAAASTMAVAVFMFHAADAFEVKELAFAYMMTLVLVFLIGPGQYSVDALMARRRND